MKLNKANHGDSFFVTASPSLQSCACWRRYVPPTMGSHGKYKIAFLLVKLFTWQNLKGELRNMQKIKTCLSNIAAVSPRSIGYLIVVGGWEPIYQVFRWFEVVGDELSGVFLTAGVVSAIAIFTFDYVGLRVRAKQRNNR